MGKGAKMAITFGSWGAVAFDLMGWILLLSGVASMQKNCGGTDANAFESGGAAGYNAPISCDVFFSYAWWITFYNLAVIAVTIAALIGFIQRFRPGVIILLAISLMQNLDTANNYLFYNYVETGSGTFDASARVATAGAIIKSIAMFFLIGLVGLRDESTTQFEKPQKPTPAATSV